MNMAKRAPHREDGKTYQEEAMPIKVIIVDDDPFVSTSLETILSAQEDIVVAGTGTDGDEACRLYQSASPDILLMDIQMSGCDGLEAAERILAADPSARIVFLTTFSDDGYIVRALRLGARGYLIKQEVAHIAPALRSVMAGQSVLGDEVIGRVDSLMRGETSAVPMLPNGFCFDELTAREQAIVELIAQGLDNAEIAAHIYIGEGTVRNHISTILQKLGLKNRTQIAVCYYRGRSR
jgi:DNA-binding NarL/FixJ family response regulator